MKLILILIVLFSFSLANAREMFMVDTISTTLLRVDLTTFVANNDFVQIGYWANDVVLHEDYLYVVNSANGTVQVINSTNGQSREIELEDGSSPSRILVHGGFAYVTGLITGKLYKIDLSNTSNIEYIEVGTSPGGLLIVDDKIFVALTGFLSYDEETNISDFEPGIVAVIDLNDFSFIKNVDVSINPQELLADSHGNIHVLCTGNYNDIPTEIVIFCSEDFEPIETITFESSFTTIQLGISGMVYLGGGFGMSFEDDEMVFASGLGSYNPETFEILHDGIDLLVAGGQKLLYDEKYIYVLLSGDYREINGTLIVLNHDFEILEEVELGLGALAMALKGGTTSVADVVRPNTLEILSYPNPFISHVQFEVKGNRSDVRLEIFNVRGQRVYETTGNNPSWNGIDRNGRVAPAGVYFARISDSNENMAVRRIMRIK